MSILASRSGTLPRGMRSAGRVAAIGDVHARADLLRAAVASIPDPAHTKLVLLGDYIDRGPDPLGTLRYIREMERERLFSQIIILPGNHDGMAWLGIQRQEALDIRVWINNGGDATLRLCDRDPWLLTAAFPDQLVQRIEGSLPGFDQDGDLLFVHAGITPGYDPRSFLQQRYMTARRGSEHLHWAWTREDFLLHEGPHIGPSDAPVLVVHGHTRIGAETSEHAIALALRFDRSRISLDASGSDMMPVLIAEGGDYELLVTGPSPEPDHPSFD